MPLVDSSYKAPFFLRNGHLATIIPSSFRKVEGVTYQRERLNTPDGDFLDLDWVFNQSDKLVIISHGLEGSASRPYVKGMAKYFSKQGWDALAWNCRSCSGELNWKPRFYHHGATEDLDQLVEYAISGKGYSTVALVGFSMGGSMTLKYLGEKGEELPRQVIGGVAYSVPVSLKSSVEALSTQGNAFYRKRFLKKLEQKIKQKAQQYPDEIKYSGFDDIKYFPDFDNLYTAPLHRFKDANDFYERASAGRYMYATQVPTLLVNALNDPFLGSACYPFLECDNHKHIFLETPKHGGHVGFSLRNDEFNYMEKRAYSFLNSL
ncbi:alpha/beta fold hydrolase [Fulvivirga sp. RKSG066]|nr:alpha/beta fold hydrolase [Fulvivirga aurantia]MTI22739.1 alpha/beta fold hydrolase [Fulvivirga aurantia]